MFSSKKSDELVFGFSPATTSQGFQIQEDLIVDHAFMDNKFINFSTESKDSRTTRFGLSKPRQRESTIKKVIHREIERKRRLEMTNLSLSLGSFLPLNHKGKLSASDRMQEATNYIKQMQKNIQELTTRRNNLKEKPNFPNDCENSDSVMVNHVPNGVEILISCRAGVGLSNVLAELLERGIDVVSCISTRTEGKFIHKILTKVEHIMSIDASGLQDRLAKAIKYLG